MFKLANVGRHASDCQSTICKRSRSIFLLISARIDCTRIQTEQKVGVVNAQIHKHLYRRSGSHLSHPKCLSCSFKSTLSSSFPNGALRRSKGTNFFGIWVFCNFVALRLAGPFCFTENGRGQRGAARVCDAFFELR